MRSGWLGSLVTVVVLAGSAAIPQAGCSDDEVPDVQKCVDPYIESLYKNLLLRPPDSETFQVWKKRYEGGWTRRKLAQSFLRMPEWRKDYVHKVFFELLRRSPNDEEM